MTYRKISEGFVSRRPPAGPTAAACGPRCAVTSKGEVLCGFMVQEALGKNDFKVRLARSSDAGETWHTEIGMWPHLQASFSIFGSVSRAPDGEFFFFGARTPIDRPGEMFWCEATQGLKPNELIWARSVDEGATWSDPQVIPMPIAGSAEAPGAMCVTRQGVWLACYSPYNTWDPAVTVDRNQVVVVRSADRGQTWQHAAMLRFPNSRSSAAEAWVIQLADGRLLGAAWHIHAASGQDQPNAYAVSPDEGRTWRPTASTGILGQSVALAPMPDGRALMIYNQRKHGAIGVWLAMAEPTDSDFGVRSNEIIWRAETSTQSGTSGELQEWTDFSFGEPSIVRLPDDAWLATFWCRQPSGYGIRYVKLRIED